MEHRKSDDEDLIAEPMPPEPEPEPPENDNQPDYAPAELFRKPFSSNIRNT
jgi:hypothetical protein